MPDPEMERDFEHAENVRIRDRVAELSALAPDAYAARARRAAMPADAAITALARHELAHQVAADQNAAVDQAFEELAALLEANPDDPHGVVVTLREKLRECERVYARNLVIEADLDEIVAIATGKRRRR